MGVLTACFGGVLRDVLAEQPSVLLRREIYVTAAIAAATVFITGRYLGLAAGLATIAAIVTGFAVRAGGIALGWILPRYRPAGETPSSS